jgi:hypothetical protein
MNGMRAKPRAVPIGVSKTVKAALWVAAIDSVPIEDRIEKVEQWLKAIDALDLWRFIEEDSHA